MGYHETKLGNEIRLEAANFGVKLFRNNVGVFELQSGGRIRTGLQNGSGDYIGWIPLWHTVDQYPIAPFLSVETKGRFDRVTDDQRKWAFRVNEDGGIAIVTRSLEEFRKSMQSVLKFFKDRGMELRNSG